MTPPELEPLLAAYRAAKAEHDAAIQALREAGRDRLPPSHDLVQRQTAAAVAEFEALAQLNTHAPDPRN